MKDTFIISVVIENMISVLTGIDIGGIIFSYY